MHTERCMFMSMTKTVEQLTQKSAVALNYTQQFRKHIDPNDPSAESKTAYLDGVGLLFSQVVMLGHSDDFAKTLARLKQDQLTIAKRMSFFGSASEAVLPHDTVKPSMQ